MNRITEAIENVRPAIDALDVEQRRVVEDATDIDFDLYCVFQERQALAHASGRLSLEEAQLVHGALGKVGDWTPGTDLATKVVIFQLMKELL